MTTPPVPATGEPPEDPVYPYRWAALFILMAAEIMDLLDSTVIGVSATPIRRSLGGTYSSIQWMAAGYTLSFAVGLITGGRLGDLYGRKRMFMIGVGGFAVMSLLCSMAQSPGMLIGFRVVQGAFAAVMIPQGFGIIKGIFKDSEMAAAFGILGPVLGIATISGPIVAGLLINANLFGIGWRAVFLLNVPLGLAALALAVKYVPESKSTQQLRLDPLGMLLSGAGAFLISYPLVQGEDAGWPAWTFIMIGCSLVVFGALILWERRKERANDSPLMVMSLFKNRAYSSGLIIGLFFFGAMASFMLVFGVFLQVGLGFSPLRNGMTMLPWSGGVAIGSGLGAGLLAPKYGRKVIHFGLIAMSAGIFGVYLTLRSAGTGTTLWDLIPTLLVGGVGMGLVIAPFFDIVLWGVQTDEVGSASGVLSADQQLGSTIGVAVFGTVFFSKVGGDRPVNVHPIAFVHAMEAVSVLISLLMVAPFAAAFLLPKKDPHPAAGTVPGQADGSTVPRAQVEQSL